MYLKYKNLDIEIIYPTMSSSMQSSVSIYVKNKKNQYDLFHIAHWKTIIPSKHFTKQNRPKHTLNKINCPEFIKIIHKMIASENSKNLPDFSNDVFGDKIITMEIKKNPLGWHTYHLSRPYARPTIHYNSLMLKALMNMLECLDSDSFDFIFDGGVTYKCRKILEYFCNYFIDQNLNPKTPTSWLHIIHLSPYWNKIFLLCINNWCLKNGTNHELSDVIWNMHFAVMHSTRNLMNKEERLRKIETRNFTALELESNLLLDELNIREKYSSINMESDIIPQPIKKIIYQEQEKLGLEEPVISEYSLSYRIERSFLDAVNAESDINTAINQLHKL